MAPKPAIYAGHVAHERLRPRRHRLRYRVFTLLLDVDDIDVENKDLCLLRYNHRGLFSIYDADHGDGSPIGEWVRKRLDGIGAGDAGHRILMLCYPRIFGYVFNPLTVYFCHAIDGALRAIVYEVHNTFDERHAYVLEVSGQPQPVIRQRCDKILYVSPFIPMNCSYDFRIIAPSEAVNITIREEDKDGLLLSATFQGRRRALTDAGLAFMAFCYPLMTLKVIAGIHWEALWLWLKGAPIFLHAASTTDARLSNLKHRKEG
jgi:DUF1365 family protein